MLISALFATANIEMNGSSAVIGKSGAAVCDHRRQRASRSSASSPTGTTATAMIETST